MAAVSFSSAQLQWKDHCYEGFVMKSDSNNHRTTPRNGDRNDVQGSVMTKGNSIGQSGTGNRYSVQSAYLSAINAKSPNYIVNNENAYPEYRPSKPIIITNQQQTFKTSHTNAAATTAIANSTATTNNIKQQQSWQ